MHFGGWLARGIVALMPVLVSACTFVPRDGPASLEVRSKADATLLDTGQLSYAFVNLTPLTVPLFAAQPEAPIRFSNAVMGGRRPDVRIGVGDVLEIRLFEAGGGGLFLPESPTGRAGSTQIPNRTVNRDGTISVPFVGQVKVAGLTTTEVERRLQEGFKARAIEPQVAVSIAESRANEVAVLGEVKSATRIPVDVRGISLIDALTQAGGSTVQEFETLVTLRRRGRTEHALLTHIMKDERQNVSLLPGDVVFVSKTQRSYLAFGATLASSGGLIGSSNRRYVFNEPNLTLADGVAQAGGLLDNRADATAVFLFRKVPRATLEKAGVDVSRFPGPLVPTIFNADWSHPEGLFLAHDFYLQDRDIIFVSNAPTQDVTKVLDFINAILGTVTNASDAINGVDGVVRIRP